MRSTARNVHDGNGWEGIRTPGALRHTRFPGVHNRPLCHPSRSEVIDRRCRTRLKLQSLEQFVEREWQADKKFPEFAVVCAHRIEAHFVDDRFNLKGVLGEKG